MRENRTLYCQALIVKAKDVIPLQTELPVTMPAVALRGLTVFPNMLLHFDVGREESIKALDEAMTTSQPVFLVTQRELDV